MSLPETQPEHSGNQRADRLDVLAAVFCRGRIEQLLDDGQKLGQLAILHSKDRELEVKLSPEPHIMHNDFQSPVLVTEAANFYAAHDDSAMTYRVQHHTNVSVIGGTRRQLRREFWMFYDRMDDTTYEINPEFSRYETAIEMCGGNQEGVATIRNEGGPLNDMQQVILDRHQHDMGLIKGYQVHEINQLVERAHKGLHSS